MDIPTMLDPMPAGPDTDALVASLPVPGLGVLPANAFLIHGSEPVLVDTGVAGLSEAFLARLRERIDLEDLRWIWLTHTDPDHASGSCRTPRPTWWRSTFSTARRARGGSSRWRRSPRG